MQAAAGPSFVELDSSAASGSRSAEGGLRGHPSASASLPPHLRADFYHGPDDVLGAAEGLELHHAAAAVLLEVVERQRRRLDGEDAHEWPGARAAVAEGGEGASADGAPDASFARFRAALDSGLDAPESLEGGEGLPEYVASLARGGSGGRHALSSGGMSSMDPAELAEALIRRVEGSLPGAELGAARDGSSQRQRSRRPGGARFSEDELEVKGGMRISGQAQQALHDADDAAATLAQQLELLRNSASSATAAVSQFAPPHTSSSGRQSLEAGVLDRQRFRKSLMDVLDAPEAGVQGRGSAAAVASQSAGAASPQSTPVTAAAHEARFRASLAERRARTRRHEAVAPVPLSLDERFEAEAEEAVQRSVAEESMRAKARERLQASAQMLATARAQRRQQQQSSPGAFIELDGNDRGEADAGNARLDDVASDTHTALVFDLGSLDEEARTALDGALSAASSAAVSAHVAAQNQHDAREAARSDAAGVAAPSTAVPDDATLVASADLRAEDAGGLGSASHPAADSLGAEASALADARYAALDVPLLAVTSRADATAEAARAEALRAAAASAALLAQDAVRAQVSWLCGLLKRNAHRVAQLSLPRVACCPCLHALVCLCHCRLRLLRKHRACRLPRLG